MKKILLFSVALFGAMTAFAQGVNKSELNKIVKTQPQAMKMEAHKGFPTIKTSAANGVYYGKPAGSFYRGAPEGAGGYYYYDMLYVSAGKELVFKNKSTNPASTTWYYNDKEASESLLSGNDFALTASPGYSYYVPVLTSGSYSYTFGEESTAWGTANAGSGMATTDDFSYMSYTDPAMGTNYSWNGTTWASGTYWFGTNCDFTSDGVTYMQSGLYQIYDKPATPLYIQNITAPFISSSSDALADGATLNLTIMDAEEYNGRMYPGENILATMTASASDLSDIEKTTPTGATQEFSFGKITFANKVLDPVLAVETEEPVVIDQPFAVIITGLQDPGVNIGFYGSAIPSADVDASGINGVQATRMLMIDPSTKEEQDWTVGYGTFGTAIYLHGVLDAIEVASELQDDKANEYTEANVFRMSDDGETMTPENSDLVNSIEGAFVYTNLPWEDEDGIANYEAELPDWVTEVIGEEVTETYEGTDYRTGQVIVSFKCEPLPTGVDGRKATIYFEGKGVKADKPIILLQGDAVNGIEGVSTEVTKANSENIYNLAGQRVSKNYKGIVIKNGRKLIQK